MRGACAPRVLHARRIAESREGSRDEVRTRVRHEHGGWRRVHRVPVYLAVLLLLKGMQSAAKLVRPFAALVPDWLPARGALLPPAGAVRLLRGRHGRANPGRAALRERLERVFFERLPGYGLLRSLHAAVGGRRGGERVAAGARRGIEDALVPGFIIEELDDGRFTVFVPVRADTAGRGRLILGRGTGASARRPLHAGYPMNLPLGAGSRELVARCETPHRDLAGPLLRPPWAARPRTPTEECERAPGTSTNTEQQHARKGARR